MEEIARAMIAAVRHNTMATNPNRRNMRTKINNNLINANNSKVETDLGFGVELLSYVLSNDNGNK